jgi:radical SAM-linked protein
MASEAEYLEIGLVETRDPERVRADLDAALPSGLDVVDVVSAGPGTALADRLEASEWRVRLDSVDPDVADRAVRAFLATSEIEVERLTKKGRRRFDTRAAVSTLELDKRAMADEAAPCAIIRMVVRHTTPAVRPDDVLTGLRHVADLAPPSPPLVTRLAQGPLAAETGELADPLDPDRKAAPGGYDATPVTGPKPMRPVGAADAGVVNARP